MQATRYVQDENEGRKVPSDLATLQLHNDFAQEVMGERKRLLADAENERSFWQGLAVNTRGRRWICGVWALEILWMLYVVLANSMEMWGSCPFQMGLSPVCQYCYTEAFLAWSCILIVVWLLQLYLSVLLISRGFDCKPSTSAMLDNEIKGIPRTASALFYALSGILLATLLGGVVVLCLSSTCQSGHEDGFMVHQPRSSLMFGTTLASVVLVPALLFLGRCF
mmetsp:Transcript_89497/g.191804  ORF Transcript_89497/g.191804 Transcript_89497/m.191804 type:complete len:223 (+) Transcript_89497:149-817(+)